MVDKLESLIKQFLENRPNPVSGRRPDADYPTPLDLFRYVSDQLAGSELERMLSFLRHNEGAQELVVRAREIVQNDEDWSREPVPPEWIAYAKALAGPKSRDAACPHCGKRITPFKKPLKSQRGQNLAWLVLAGAGLALSFIFPHYFIQSLVVTALAGVKCIVEMRATKTQILIYKALSADEGPEHQRLHPHVTHL